MVLIGRGHRPSWGGASTRSIQVIPIVYVYIMNLFELFGSVCLESYLLRPSLSDQQGKIVNTICRPNTIVGEKIEHGTI